MVILEMVVRFLGHGVKTFMVHTSSIPDLNRVEGSLPNLSKKLRGKGSSWRYRQDVYVHGQGVSR